MNIAIIIPARGGSKTIPQKNIYPLLGKPLLAYTIAAAKASGVAKNIFVTTDSEEIAKVAIDYGVEVIRRPQKLSTDSASTESALIHALGVIKKEKKWEPDLILTLPPTAPLRSAKTIKKFVAHYLFISNKHDAMVSFTETKGDYWLKDNGGKFKRLFPDAPRRRQERDSLYLENSAIYITKKDALLATKSILGKNCAGFVIDAFEAVDINQSVDLKWVEFIIKNNLK